MPTEPASRSTSGSGGEATSAARADRREARIKWLAFGVVLPLLPIVARVFGAIVLVGLKALTFTYLFADGELLVIATVIAAAGIGEVIFSRHVPDWKNLRRAALAIIFALLVIVCSVLIYGFGAVDVPGFPPGGLDEVTGAMIAQKVAVSSVVMFAISLAVGYWCIRVSTTLPGPGLVRRFLGRLLKREA